MALFRGEDSDNAYDGAILLAEALRTIRDYDANTFQRQW
jgi:hypothetical protein